ncbi:MAG: hypothetical protein ACYTBP_04485 [Planctomycetota bacterium]
MPWVQFFQDRGAQSGGGTFTAYDIDGNIVINESFNTSGKTFHTFDDWGYVGEIHRIYIGYCKDGVDDLTFPEPVPEPACEVDIEDSDSHEWIYCEPVSCAIEGTLTNPNYAFDGDWNTYAEVRSNGNNICSICCGLQETWSVPIGADLEFHYRIEGVDVYQQAIYIRFWNPNTSDWDVQWLYGHNGTPVLDGVADEILPIPSLYVDASGCFKSSIILLNKWSTGAWSRLYETSITVVCEPEPACSAFKTIDFSSSHNARMQDFDPTNAQYFPEGELVLGCVPFSIPSGTNNIWQSNASPGSPDYVEITVNEYGVAGVHTLINTHGGVTGGPYAWMEFFGTSGAYYKKDLYGDVDMRDYYYNWYTNNINGTTTTNVFTYGSGYQNEVRLDKQWIDLPSLFDTETLTSIRLTDTGTPSPGQYPFLAGVTVEVACEEWSFVHVDIKPTNCPNPINVTSKGVLPVAILGTEDFDVNKIDVSSIRLDGVAPIRSSYEDVTTPVSDGNDCDCNEEGADGFTDLTLKFEIQDIVGAIGDVNDGDVLPLTLTGVLDISHCERPITGSDCIVIRGKAKSLHGADIKKDGVVDMDDFAILSEKWLQSAILED